MDVSNLLATQSAKLYVEWYHQLDSLKSHIHQFSQSITVDKETPLDIDAGFLTVTDLNPIDEESYSYVLPLVFLLSLTRARWTKV